MSACDGSAHSDCAKHVFSGVDLDDRASSLFAADAGLMGADTCRFGGRLVFRAEVSRTLAAESVSLRLYRDDDMSRREIRMELTAFGDSADIYETEIDTVDICPDGSGLFYYCVAIDTLVGRLFTKNDGSLTVNEDEECRQLTVFERDFTVPERFMGGMMYQIFPDRFAIGRGTRYTERVEMNLVGRQRRTINPDWDNGIPQYAEYPGGEVANDEFFGGDLWGVAEKLDYIKSLGVKTIYLCPIFEAASNHRYDTGDYLKVDPLLGGDAALYHLISEVRKRGMLLILDGVFNHTGADSRYFNRFSNYPGAGAYHSKRSKYFKWYTFNAFPDDYRCWWGVKILPAVKSAEPSYLDFICGKNGVLERWLDAGIDGWRLDVADELSDVFLENLRKTVKEKDAEAIVLGEVWEDASNKVAYSSRRRYFRGKQLDSVMNYPLKEAVIGYVMNGGASTLRETARTIYSHYPETVGHVLMNFLGTHDTERILTVLSGVGSDKMSNAALASWKMTGEERKLAEGRLRIAWSLTAAFPGMPCVYYGDERGMEGGRDPFNRRPLVRDETTLTDFYREVGRIHASERAMLYGNLEMPETGDDSRFLLLRRYGGELFAAAANMSETGHELEFMGKPELLMAVGMETDVKVVINGRSVFVPPKTVVYIHAKNGQNTQN